MVDVVNGRHDAADIEPGGYDGQKGRRHGADHHERESTLSPIPPPEYKAKQHAKCGRTRIRPALTIDRYDTVRHLIQDGDFDAPDAMPQSADRSAATRPKMIGMLRYTGGSDTICQARHPFFVAIHGELSAKGFPGRTYPCGAPIASAVC